ncbi:MULTISPECIES: multidrug efflux RND transporter permease subunit [unclassified Janthinobacterium]|uniref:multidrug efflux RND transporter permease subunit n=1 Tax=unclassified Janthinobacterium TaxID=2610881 RepID=UPI0016198F74|nr:MULTISPECIES: multidrug efflux RND transporter permease subunit [unclassified Janthinobacterium]MBB5371257.1 multidrug efflux pump [Janthinobacterium sp. K2C7]MBB5384063.1 multidrug efflux pump [Janthinobacterium sp. K2Li3]MBB5389477.1 multidrug efflux pump [Janthinobacterium sp. K2E3]
MNISAPFIARPVATTLLTLAVALAGVLGFMLLPIAPLPQVDFPTISVSASLPGASPDTMAATVATPLERSLGSIAGVNEITSRSSLGSTSITMQFELDRDIDGAARDVQAAINAARTLLPTGLPSNPTYRKVNPADAPIMILALTSSTLTRGQMYDAASTVLAQRLSQVQGIGQVNVGGGALPAVRVELDPDKLAAKSIGIDTVRTAITSTNANRPKGAVEQDGQSWQIGANDQARTAADYAPVLLSYRDGAAVRLRDVATLTDSVQDVRNYGVANGKPAIALFLLKQPGANIIETVERVRALLPQLQASIPAAIDMNVISDRTPTIRASLREVERSLAIAIGLVVLVVLAFLRNWRAAVLPAVAVPVSLAGTLGVMYLCGYSLDNLSAMALTVATGFVVDDAIVVLENISRHMEQGMGAREAALKGAREIGFTVVSISISLIAVFIPLLLMGGVVGRLFREFAVVLSTAILISMFVSLSTTPMMASVLLKPPTHKRPGKVGAALARASRRLMRGYRRSLAWTLRHQPVAIIALLAVIGLNVFLYTAIPKTFFPQQDTGVIVGSVQADQGSSFQIMQQRVDRFVKILRADPAVANVSGSTGGNQINTANFYITLKPLAERKLAVDAVVARLRGRLSHEPGANLFLVPVQDIRIGGRQANAQYQYTLQGDDIDTLRTWEPRIRNALVKLPELTDVNSDQQDKGAQTALQVDRDAAARLGVSMTTLDNTLNDAFGQRQVGVIYNPLNQYRVVMELASPYLQGPETLNKLYVSSASGAQVPLSAFATIAPRNTPLSVNHQGGSPASTVSFNLPLNMSLSEATGAIDKAMQGLGLPASVRGSFQGTANAFQQSLSSQPILIAAAIVTVYLVLGMLYESLVHPITILSTLPSAGVGALLALMLFKTQFSIIALIGVILLIGIVKKNAIMMIDFAITRQRAGHMGAGAAIFRAANLRLRPILMTTVAAIFGAIPLAVGSGDGAELRQPLGIAIVGGLILSQLLTLYTTPVVYVLMDRFRRQGSKAVPAPDVDPSHSTLIAR